MPAPFAITSNTTELPVWVCDDQGNVIQSGTLTLRSGMTISGSTTVIGNQTVTGTLTVGARETITGSDAGGLLLVTNGSATTTGTIATVEATNTSVAYATSVAGDTNPRWQVDSTGKMSWGPGNAALDAFMLRLQTNVLQLPDTRLQINRASATSPGLSLQVDNDTNDRLSIRVDGRLSWGPGNTAADTNLYRFAAHVVATDDNISLQQAGRGFQVKEGTNAKMGTAVLAAGTATVSTTAVAATSRVFLTSQVDGGAPGFLRVSTRVAGTSFTITSSSGTDTSTVAWLIFDPS